MGKTSVFVLVFVAATTGVCGWGVQGRRYFLQAVPLSGLAILSPPQTANAILSSKYCAAGVGDGCEDRSEGNEYIKSLQEKSALNREANLKVSHGARSASTGSLF